MSTKSKEGGEKKMARPKNRTKDIRTTNHGCLFLSSGSRVKLDSWGVGELLLILLILLDFQGSNMCKLISICAVI
jgi:hypothetical protein